MTKTPTKKVSDRVLKTINTQKITPIPRWEFILKNSTIWLLLLVSIILLIIASSLSIFSVLENIISPYFWFLTATAFLLLAYIFLTKTKGSYRLNFLQKFIPILVLGLLVGFTLFRFGTARRLDHDLARRFAPYRQLAPLKIQNWSRPPEGFLSGTITKVIDQNNFYLNDFSGKTWHIIGDNLFIRSRIRIASGESVKLIGRLDSPDTFRATDIRPWTNRRGF